MKQAPIKYFGGKGNMIGKLLELFPPVSEYDHFLDAYGGAGTVLLNKPVTPVEVYNDLNRNAHALFAVLVDKALFLEFQRLTEVALYDELTSEEYLVALTDDTLTLVERAFRFWYVSRVRHGSGIGGFVCNSTIRRGMSKSTSDFLSSVDGLSALHTRLSRVVVRNCDAIKLIPQFDYKRALIYLDPPYVHSTRGGARYETDADDNHHVALVEVLNSIRNAYVVLSGYDNPIYDSLKGFTKHSFEVATVDGHNVPKTKREFVWRNFEPMRLLL